MNLRTKVIVGFTAVSVAAAFLLPAVPQPTAYHHFADQRADFGVERFLDVASNAGFLISGLLGLGLLIGRRVHFQFESERWPYRVFFFGILRVDRRITGLQHTPMRMFIAIVRAAIAFITFTRVV